MIQQINVRKNNQMVLHAGIGCWRDVTSQQTGIGGEQASCDVSTNRCRPGFSKHF